MGEADAVFSILGHPIMRLDEGFIELLVGLVFRDSVTSLSEHIAVRAANHAMDE